MKRALALLITVHRWLGVVFCLIVFVWFASGIVMIYKRMPAFTDDERVARLPPLSTDRIRLSPAEAALKAGVDAPRRVRLLMIDSRPAYQFFAQQRWTTVFADDGAAFEPLTSDQAVDTVAAGFGAFPARHHLALLTQPDQWTFGVSIRTTGPLHKVALGDERDTEVYIARESAQVVMKTDRDSRFWGYAGAVLHWFYFTPLRQQSGLWSSLIIYGSFAGCVLSLSGLFIGLVRFSRSLRTSGSASPYVGWLRWHHYAGLLFGVVTFTWIFSGMLSMSPWNWSPGNAPRPAQVEAVRGGPLNLTLFTLPPFTKLRRGVHEIELMQFRGQPFYDLRTGFGIHGLSVPILISATTGEWIERFSADDLLGGARLAMPGVAPIETVMLKEYDAYYYDKTGRRPLPVLRVKYDDADRTWLYLNTRDGQLLRREVTRSRIERWLYHGLHSLDFPVLYQTRGLWEVVVIALSLGGIALSVTSLAIAYRAVRHATGAKRRVTT